MTAYNHIIAFNSFKILTSGLPSKPELDIWVKEISSNLNPEDIPKFIFLLIEIRNLILDFKNGEEQKNG